MDLETLRQGTADWGDISEAAAVIWRASTCPHLDYFRTTLQNHLSDAKLTAIDLHTAIDNTRRAVVVCSREKITIAFQGSQPYELFKNTWIDGKGPKLWDLPFPSPKQITVAGFSMGGGISILAFTDILEHIRTTCGSASPSPQPWAVDSNLGSLFQHFTFAAVAAGDQGYYTVLNNLYERYKIRAWDFLNHRDMTVHTHHFALRSWRGHRYILPEAVVGQYSAEFGHQGHFILGYLKAAEWMAVNGTDQVKSAYSY
ncbi:hypothetical protein P153DRAFT_376802 [Dothidotthia symphoricarpi CBS 119687]|uniref:Fungal lipase-like domain-containing protein n=1 Tax=Dothidotthia symphoricarpi CBS 119687 TaxID=1392245 RepID=A0A6A6A8H7_9PLEO|nr:uncharacterized protein P153DRAFT_376802 [Dothidotthia symphoricarpi CBS 119687]KAF2127856.1 hypothetical protein P153DRAFT_376802 [Dothidotthia symphoricarpi CBS 119687]